MRYRLSTAVLIVTTALLAGGCVSSPSKPGGIASADGYSGLEGSSSRQAASADSLRDLSLPQQWTQTALGQLGIPYRPGGSSPKQGFDCSGLVAYSLSQVGVDAPRSSQEQFNWVKGVSKGDLQTGDLVFFRIRSKRISHVGIYLSDGRFVHAPVRGRSVTVENLRDPYWSRVFAGAGRPPMIAPDATGTAVARKATGTATALLDDGTDPAKLVEAATHLSAKPAGKTTAKAPASVQPKGQAKGQAAGKNGIAKTTPKTPAKVAKATPAKGKPDAKQKPTQAKKPAQPVSRTKVASR